MNKIQVNLFIAGMIDKLPPYQLPIVKEQLENAPDDKFIVLSAAHFKDPNTALILAVLTGCDRFYLGQIGLNILKLLLMFFLVGFIWWFIDIFTARQRTQTANLIEFNRFMLF